MIDLTQKQKRVLEFIRKKVREEVPPTIREIAGFMGFSSTGTVRDYLAALEKKGYLQRTGKLSRYIELKTDFRRGIPIIGTITAGKPNLAYENIQGYLNPDDLFLGRLSQSDVFALRVKGDSMLDAGINDGDIALIKKQHTAQPGEIIAALLDDEATLKRLRLKQDKYFLEAANSNYPPIYKDFTIIGKLLTLIRKY